MFSFHIVARLSTLQLSFFTEKIDVEYICEKTTSGKNLFFISQYLKWFSEKQHKPDHFQ